MEAAEEDVDEEEQEVLLVVVADAVVHPRAMVVHAGDAPLAGRAVMALRRLERGASLALLRQNTVELPDLDVGHLLEVLWQLPLAESVVVAGDATEDRPEGVQLIHPVLVVVTQLLIDLVRRRFVLGNILDDLNLIQVMLDQLLDILFEAADFPRYRVAHTVALDGAGRLAV